MRTEADTYLVKSRKRIQLIGSTILGRQAMINIGMTSLMLNINTSSTTTSTTTSATIMNDSRRESINNKKNKLSTSNITSNISSNTTTNKRTCISLQHVMHHKRFVE